MLETLRNVYIISPRTGSHASKVLTDMGLLQKQRSNRGVICAAVYIATTLFYTLGRDEADRTWSTDHGSGQTGVFTVSCFVAALIAHVES